MKILAIESALEYGSIAVYADGRICSKETLNSYSHLKDLFSLMDYCLKEAKIKPSELDYVGADVGPGSFTGIRIGITAARTICQFTGARAVSLSSLLAICSEAPRTLPVLAIINARRRQTYAAMYQYSIELGEYVNLIPEGQYMIDEIIKLANSTASQGYIINGDGILAYEGEIIKLAEAGGGELASQELWYPKAKSGLALIQGKVSRMETLPYQELEPRYMRLAEAEQKLKDGKLSERIKY